MKNLVKIFLSILLLLACIQGVQAAETYKFVTNWGSYGTDNGQFSIPNGIAVDSLGNVYVADGRDEQYRTGGNYRVQKFNSDGTFLATWGTYGSGNGQFSNPQGVAVDSSGNVYVTDGRDIYMYQSEGNYRVQKFDSNGKFITKWGSLGMEDGQFNRPMGIAVDSSDNVYVTDSINNTVQKFDSNGKFITKWGSEGTKDGQFSEPTSIAVDFLGNVYVADSYNKRVQKFDSTGKFITKWGSLGMEDGQFNRPMGIAVDSSGNVYVAESYNKRVQKFDSTGKYLMMWGSPGPQDGQFSYPQNIAVDLLGNVYVADSGNKRVLKFTPGQSLLSVSSITPTTTKNTGVVSITGLIGAGFAAGAKVTFTKTGSQDIIGTSVTVLSPTKITCILDLNGKEAGPWNVVVTNSDGISATLSGGFTITDAPSPPLDSYDETLRLISHDMCSSPLKISFSDSNNVLPHSPDVHKNQVVFVEQENIYLLDLPAGTIQELTTNGGNSEPATGDSGVVWVHSNANSSFASDPATSQIYYYSTITGETRQITTGNANRSQPDISGDKIVWTDSRSGNEDIYLYDIIDQTETQITEDPADQDAPAISDNWIVMRDGRDGPNKTIYLYNLLNKDFSRISSTGHEETGAPEIAGTRVAWAGKSSILYLYDIPTKIESSLPADISEDVGVSISSNQLVWHDPHWRPPLPKCPTGMYCPVPTCCPPEYQAIKMYLFSDTTQEEVYLRQVFSGYPGGPRLANFNLRPKVSNTLLVWVTDKISVCSLSNQNISSINLQKIPYSSHPLVSSQRSNLNKMNNSAQGQATFLPSYLSFIAISGSIAIFLSIVRRKDKK